MNAKKIISLLSIGRILVGIGAIAAPGPAGGQWIGSAAKDPATQVMIRAFGIREIAVGAATLGAVQASGTKGMGFKILVMLGIAVDVVDATATLEASEHLPMGGKPTIAIAAGAAGAGILSLLRR